jgi:cytochrome b6-f complex iron-sulfur subunit
MATSQSPGGGEPTGKPTAPVKSATAKAATAPAKAPPPSEDGEQSVVQSAELKSRRRLVWTAITGFLIANFLMFLRFFFPRTLFEPSSRFRIGFPSDFPPGVDERFKQAYRIWVVRSADRMFVIYGKCTHLGCTPNWIESENKFKCPCHGSGYDIEGRNFEGPAPRPMDRAAIELDAEGQIVVDLSRLYACPPGGPCQFESDPNSYLVIS